MMSGRNRSLRLAPTEDDVLAESMRSLTWTTAGPWTYTLGGFGTIAAIFGLRLWAARVNGFTIGLHESLGEARRTVERAAREAGYFVADDA